MVHNVTMSNCGSAARIKVYQDAIPNADGSLPTSSGGGSGYVRNVTYESMQENTCDCMRSVRPLSPKELWLIMLQTPSR